MVYGPIDNQSFIASEEYPKSEESDMVDHVSSRDYWGCGGIQCKKAGPGLLFKIMARRSLK